MRGETPLLYVYLIDLILLEGLGIANVDYYWYLNQSGTYTVDGMDDKKDFQETMVCICSFLILP